MAAAGDYYGAPYCGGLVTGLGRKSGKGGGPNLGAGQRGQKVLLWPSWGGKKGTDVYLSSRWDGTYQIYDLYWTPKNITQWWQSKKYDWVFIQELPYDLRMDDFVWSQATNPTAKMLKKKHWFQKMEYEAAERRKNLKCGP